MATYSSHFSIRRLWTILAAGMLVMFGTLLYFGAEIYQAAPPIPTAVRTASGATMFTREQILAGQNVWQSLGGMHRSGALVQPNERMNHRPTPERD